MKETIIKYWNVANDKTNQFVAAAEKKIHDLKTNYPEIFRVALAVSSIAVNILKFFLAPIFFPIGSAIGLVIGLAFSKQVAMLTKNACDIYDSANGMGKIALLIGVAVWFIADPGMAPGIALGSLTAHQACVLLATQALK